MSATRTAMRVPHPGSREWRPVDLLDSFAGWKTAVQTALLEDAPGGDITTETFIGSGRQVTWFLRSRESGVLAGKEVVSQVFRSMSESVSVDWIVHDGQHFSPGDTLARLTGQSDLLLTGERVALNYLQRLSGIATRTHSFASAIEGTSARVLDTRKTTPGLRGFEKYAVCCGGGRTHRMTLSDVVMIKDNHLAALDHDWHRVAIAIQSLRADVTANNNGLGHIHVEIEVDRMDQINSALQAGADSLLLDGFSIEDLLKSVELVDGRVPLEASGGVTLTTIRGIAETGVDFISVGALTNGYPSVDIGLDAVEG